MSNHPAGAQYPSSVNRRPCLQMTPLSLGHGWHPIPSKVYVCAGHIQHCGAGPPGGTDYTVHATLLEAVGELVHHHAHRFDALAEASMGTHWADLSASQRSDFSEVLKQLVERSYRSNLERIKDYDVTYGDAARRGTSVFVSTQARSTENRRAPAVTIDYEMKIVNDEWRVVNVVTDGQSLVENYRSQFHTLIERDGFDGLMERMRGRLNG